MSETTTQTWADLSGSRLVMLFSHAVQLLLAVIIMGLDVYGVCYVAYNALVCSLVVSICTIIVCMYLIVSNCWLRKFYSPYVVAAYHAWMLLFWVVDLGLVAHLAQLWQGPECKHDFHHGYICAPYEKRDSNETQTTLYSTFYGSLVAGAVLAAFELALWVLTTLLTFLSLAKYRFADSTTSIRDRGISHPQLLSPNAVINMDQISNPNLPELVQGHASSALWDRTPSLPDAHREQIIPDTTTDETASLPSPSRLIYDPQLGFSFGLHVPPSGKNVSVDTSLPVLPSIQRNNVSAESSAPPRDTDEVDWSERSSFRITNPSIASFSSTSDGRGPRRTVRDV